MCLGHRIGAVNLILFGEYKYFSWSIYYPNALVGIAEGMPVHKPVHSYMPWWNWFVIPQKRQCFIAKHHTCKQSHSSYVFRSSASLQIASGVDCVQGTWSDGWLCLPGHYLLVDCIQPKLAETVCIHVLCPFMSSLSEVQPTSNKGTKEAPSHPSERSLHCISDKVSGIQWPVEG